MMKKHRQLSLMIIGRSMKMRKMKATARNRLASGVDVMDLFGQKENGRYDCMMSSEAYTVEIPKLANT